MFKLEVIEQNRFKSWIGWRMLPRKEKLFTVQEKQKQRHGRLSEQRLFSSGWTVVRKAPPSHLKLWKFHCFCDEFIIYRIHRGQRHNSWEMLTSSRAARGGPKRGWTTLHHLMEEQVLEGGARTTRASQRCVQIWAEQEEATNTWLQFSTGEKAKASVLL